MPVGADRAFTGLSWAATAFLASLAGLGRCDTGHCTRRYCLPDDLTQDPKLCYVRTALAESYAPCGDKFCDACLTDLPCESFCSSGRRAQRSLGESCDYDWECSGGIFSRCLQRVCRRALHTGQRCNAEDANDVCVFGKKSCFRKFCQGLKTDDHCWEGYPEGRDIDCAPGWYCYLGKCTAQLPKGHECFGQHPKECIRGYRCNTALEHPRCLRQYTMNLGDLSSDASLCKSNHVNPRTSQCTRIPEILYKGDVPSVLGKDCVSHTDCPRADNSLGECRCKIWWEGADAPGYCELSVPDSGRPAFKRFWEASIQKCHHDWDEERCAFEVQLEDVMLQNKRENNARLSDPTTVQECARSVLSRELDEAAHATRMHKTWGLGWLVVLALACS